MLNESVFLLQVLIISLFLKYLTKEENYHFLYSFFSLSILLINLLVNMEVKIFGISATCVEPYAVALFWISAVIYSKEGLVGAKKLTKLTILTNLFCFILFSTFNFYVSAAEEIYWKNLYKILINKTNISLLISTLTFFITYFFERKVFSFLKNFKFFFQRNILCQSFSVSASQLLDTTIYAFLFFTEKSFFTKIQLIFFSYLIKLISIVFYTIILI